MDIQTLKQLLELGWPGIVTAFLVIMAWRYYTDTRGEIEYLRKRIDELEKEIGGVREAVETEKKFRLR